MKPLLATLALALVLGLVACAPADTQGEPREAVTRPPAAAQDTSERTPPVAPTPTVHTLVIQELKTMEYPVPPKSEEDGEGETEDVQAVIKPPNATDVFELVDARWGIPGGGTRYLAAHAVGPTFDGPAGPGNQWSDLRTGDRVVVQGQNYMVTAVEETPKAWSDDLDARFKERVPGRLLLVTCIPLEQGGTATSNRIIWTEAE